MTIGTYILVSLIKIAIAVFVLLTGVAYTTLAERKVVARIQNRWGPSRVGPFGVWQPLADGLKFIFKEDITPPFVNKPLYLLAPILSLTVALTAIAVVPIGPWVTIGGIHTPLQIADVNIGLLIILGLTSIGVYGIALAGMVVQQQVFDDGQPARDRADGELRDRARPVAGWHSDSFG